MSGHNTLEELVTSEFDIDDPGAGGAIGSPGKQGGVVSLESAAAETRTLKNPERAGLELTIGFQTNGGDVVITSESAINQTGNNTLILADAGDQITLKSIRLGNTFVWRVTSNDGVALLTV
ncbi:MAG: hypothetical protein AAF958_13325 [Planctomycetota bacterium]